MLWNKQQQKIVSYVWSRFSKKTKSIIWQNTITSGSWVATVGFVENSILSHVMPVESYQKIISSWVPVFGLTDNVLCESFVRLFRLAISQEKVPDKSTTDTILILLHGYFTLSWRVGSLWRFGSTPDFQNMHWSSWGFFNVIRISRVANSHIEYC